MLATPLASSIRKTHPQAEIHWLVFASTADILKNNSAADHVICMPTEGGLIKLLTLVSKIFQRYDCAISVQAGDRPSLLARFGGRKAYTFSGGSRGSRLRDRLFTSVVTADPRDHQIDRVLSLARPVGLSIEARLLYPTEAGQLPAEIDKPYVVFHPGAAFRYKQWNKNAWRNLASKFLESGYLVAVTGGPDDEEREYLDDLFINLGVIRLDGRLSWSELANLLGRAKYFVGVDTSVTHLAAAVGTLGLAVFGPTDPAIWRPRGNTSAETITVIQNDLPCVPCQQEGCERHIGSYARCLDELPSDKIWSRVQLDLQRHGNPQ